MMPGRFFLGVGTGENLNEHILGDPWPRYGIRRKMLEEAVEIIRLLWQGGIKSYQGRYYTVANAQVYTLPEEPLLSYSQQADPARPKWRVLSVTALSVFLLMQSF